jgi:hypothetical protein
MLRFASRQVAADYAREFQQLFEGSFGTGKSSATPFPLPRAGAILGKRAIIAQASYARKLRSCIAIASFNVIFVLRSYVFDLCTSFSSSLRKFGIALPLLVLHTISERLS